MKRLLIILCILGMISSCGVSNRSADYAYKGEIKVGICKNGSKKKTIRYFKKCVRHAGAKPLFFPAYATTDEMAEAYVASVDAVIIPGKAGGDTTGRGKYDYKVIRAALAQGKPILGICLGHQEINSVYGGKISRVSKIHPDSEIKHMDKVDNYNAGLNSEAHPMIIDTSSRLYRIFGREEVMVNTSHNFSISTLGEGLTVTATAPDGVIEAIEDNSRNVMGVQFHPEFLYGKLRIKSSLEIFRNLVNEARQVRSLQETGTL